ncbi:MAG: NAD(+)/NADH kinase [Patescibacteria group bacterium]
MAKRQKKNGIKKVGIISKHNIASSADYLRKLVEEIKKFDKDILLDEYSAKTLGEKTSYDKAALLRRCDLVIVLGGDGTLLKAARAAGRSKQAMVAGVNMGHLGFLTGFTPQRFFSSLPRIFAGNFHKDERFLLRVTMYRDGKKRYTTLALNEAVINQGGFARLIKMMVEINQRQLAHYKADGLIIATPTGSTGHALSANGPIIHPRIEGFVLVPLCPARLGVRPIVIPNDRQVVIKLETQWRAEKKPIVLTIDGQITINLKRGDSLRIRTSSRKFTMIRMAGHNYYRMLRQKLGWGE